MFLFRSRTCFAQDGKGCMKGYKVGDRVVFTKKYATGPSCGLTGVIIYIGFDAYAVEFDDEFFGGHDCASREGGRGRYGHCWWCSEGDLDHEDIEFVPCFDSIFDLLS